jgi:hypothetical protein
LKLNFIVSREPQFAFLADYCARSYRLQIVLADVKRSVKHHRDICPIVHDEEYSCLPAQLGRALRLSEHCAREMFFMPELKDFDPRFEHCIDGICGRTPSRTEGGSIEDWIEPR